ncbi:hypothetical protein ABK040_001132 [Willaertia magna]
MSFSLPSTFSSQQLGTLDEEDNNQRNNNEGSSNTYGVVPGGEEDEEEMESNSESGSESEEYYENDNSENIQNDNDNSIHPPHQNSTSLSGIQKKKLRKKRRLIEKKENLIRNQIIAHLTPEQYDRFENYKRSSFKTVIKRIISNTTNAPVNKTVEIAVAGIAKLYVGELVELSKTIQREWGEDVRQALEPRHIREAYRRLREKDNRKKKYAFR